MYFQSSAPVNFAVQLNHDNLFWVYHLLRPLRRRALGKRQFFAELNAQNYEIQIKLTVQHVEKMRGQRMFLTFCKDTTDLCHTSRSNAHVAGVVAAKFAVVLLGWLGRWAFGMSRCGIFIGITQVTSGKCCRYSWGPTGWKLSSKHGQSLRRGRTGRRHRVQSTVVRVHFCWLKFLQRSITNPTW